jgi:hypothetical protein
MFLRVQWRITARCSSFDIWFVHVHKTLKERYSPLEQRLNPEYGWHHVRDGGVLPHVIWPVAFHEMSVLGAILRTFWPPDISHETFLYTSHQNKFYRWSEIQLAFYMWSSQCFLGEGSVSVSDAGPNETPSQDYIINFVRFDLKK